jgi:AP-3 complex subunit delta-1
LQLFHFIQADLNAHKPKSPPGFSTPGPSSSTEDLANTEPRFPKSLYLIQPLFATYELNPVALSAQASIPVPEGLDLDAWIVPPPREPVPVEEAGKKKAKKSKKGKGKEMNGGKINGTKKKLREEEYGDVLTPAEPDVETPEDVAERARVCFY